jgi:hypothetical protein
MTPYELWQLEKYGNITPGTTEPDDNSEREVRLPFEPIEIEKPEDREPS